MDGSRVDDEAGQLALMPEVARARARKARESAAKKAAGPKPVDPRGRTRSPGSLVDVPLAHLDRPFDYLVPQKMADDAVPRARVKVRFAGQDVDGFVLERVEESSHEGRLAPLRRAVSPEPVLSPAIAHLSASVAARYAGTRSDVLRLAVPTRHATVEKEPSPRAPRTSVDVGAAAAAWARYTGGEAFVRHLADGGEPRGRCGRRRPARTGRPRWPGPPPRRRRPAAAPCSACPTTVTWPGSTRR